MNFTAGGTIRSDKTGSVNSELNWKAGKDILFDSIISGRSHITLDADGSIARWNGI